MTDERLRRYRNKKIGRGLVQVGGWVPVEIRDSMKELAAAHGVTFGELLTALAKHGAATGFETAECPGVKLTIPKRIERFTSR